MTLALFDLDNTLICGDSDHAWGQFVVTKGLVDAKQFAQKNDQFYSDYGQGVLDASAYLKFALEPLSRYSMQELNEFHTEFMTSHIAPMWLVAAEKLIDKHRTQNHKLVVITSTNRFVVEPIVQKLGIDNIICSEPEIREGRYTGNFLEEPCFREGKITKLQRWLNTRPETMADAWFYSDSFNDIPLLEQVENPVAVDPDNHLKARAEKAGWQILSLRG